MTCPQPSVQLVQHGLRVMDDGLGQLRQQMDIGRLLCPTVGRLKHRVHMQIVGHFKIGGLLFERNTLRYPEKYRLYINALAASCVNSRRPTNCKNKAFAVSMVGNSSALN